MSCYLHLSVFACEVMSVCVFLSQAGVSNMQAHLQADWPALDFTGKSTFS